MTSLVEALRPRAQKIAASVARTMKQAGTYSASWDTYHEGEMLVGELVSQDAIVWHRPPVFAGTEKAYMFMENIQRLKLSSQEFGETVPIGAQNVESHYGGLIEVAEGSVYKDTLSYQWSKLTSREDAYGQQLKVAIEEWIRGGAGSSQSGLAVGVTQTNQLTFDFNQKYGSQSSETSTFSREVTLNEPGLYSVTFIRRSGDSQQRVTVDGDFEHSIRFEDRHQVKYDRNPFLEAFGWQPPTRNLLSFGWASMAELLGVMRREAPSNYALYNEYMAVHENEDYIKAIEAPPGKVSFVLDFKDNVQYDVTIRKTIRAATLTPATPVSEARDG